MKKDKLKSNIKFSDTFLHSYIFTCFVLDCLHPTLVVNFPEFREKKETDIIMGKFTTRYKKTL